MKFLVDNQLPIALARYLASLGVVRKHVFDLGLAESSDNEIWANADRHAYIVISKDEDFCHLANGPLRGARFIWIRLGNCRTKTLLTLMERTWPLIIRDLDAGEQIIEIR